MVRTERRDSELGSRKVVQQRFRLVRREQPRSRRGSESISGISKTAFARFETRPSIQDRSWSKPERTSLGPRRRVESRRRKAALSNNMIFESLNRRSMSSRLLLMDLPLESNSTGCNHRRESMTIDHAGSIIGRNLLPPPLRERTTSAIGSSGENRLYHVIVAGPETFVRGEEAQAFLDSFELTE